MAARRWLAPGLGARLHALMSAVTRIAQIDARFDHLEKQFDTRFVELEKRMALRFELRLSELDESLTNRFDGKLADLERRLTIRLGGMMVAGIGVLAALDKLI